MQTLNMKIKGLFTFPNTFSEIPQGAALIADNVVIDAPSIAASRRGFRRYGQQVSATEAVRKIFPFKDRLVVHTGTEMFYDSDGAGTWVQFSGTYEDPIAAAGARIQSAESNKNMYLTTREGIFKMTSFNSTPTLAGAPKALGGSGVTTGASGFLSHNTNVAYRIVWGYRDANDNLILGAPSQRIIVSNSSGGTRNVSLTFQIPTQVTTTWFYQLYRSDQSATLSDTPNDNMLQVFEANPTSGQITAREVIVTDTTPNELRQQPLYTNQDQQGITQANWQPPFAHDLDTYKGFMFYANTRSQQRYTVNLVSVGGSVGLQINDTITFTDLETGVPAFTITAKAVQNAALGEFELFTSGTPSQNIEQTAISMIAVINKYAVNQFLNAYYMSDFDSLPGEILLEKNSLSVDAFYVNSNRPLAFSPQVQPSGQESKSSSDTLPNNIYFSKFQQPEAVPLLNTISVGSSNQPIERILSLRDGVIVLKGDGVFRISGDNPANFRVTLIDNTVQIISPQSAVVLSNQVFLLSDQGIVGASDTGVAVYSRPIERTVLELTSPTIYPNMRETSFAVAYNSDRKYILGFPSLPNATTAEQEYVYNTFTDSWTRWDKDFTCGVLDPFSNKLVMGSPVDPVFGSYVYIERKDYTPDDFADEEFLIDITGFTGTTVNVVDTSNLEVGDTIRQISSGQIANIVTIVDATTLIVDGIHQWTIGPAVAYRPIECTVKMVQIDSENPGMMKIFYDFSVMFTKVEFESLKVDFQNDISDSTLGVTIASSPKGTWGTFPWGQQPWGGALLLQAQRLRTLIPQELMRCNWLFVTLTNKQAFTSFSLAGTSVMFELMSERIK